MIPLDTYYPQGKIRLRKKCAQRELLLGPLAAIPDHLRRSDARTAIPLGARKNIKTNTLQVL